MAWLMGCLLFLLTAGFAKLSTIVLNRVQAIPQPKKMIVVTELIHLATLPIYAYLLFDVICRNSAQRIFDMQTVDLYSQFSRCLIVIGVVGCIELARSAIAFQRYRPPECQIAADSPVIDFRDADSNESWKETLVGARPSRLIALLPGNEQFTLEVNTKTFLLPRVPEEWDGLSIVHLTDVHFFGAVTRKYFELVCDEAVALKPDLFVFTGDLLDDPSLLDWLSSTFGRLKAPLGQYFITGNHDWYQDTNSIRREFKSHGWIDLSSRSLELESLTAGPAILLRGDETPWMGESPDAAFAIDSPVSNLTQPYAGQYQLGARWGFDIVLAGHTHGGQIRLPVLGPIYSPSRFGCRYASGVFWLDPTLLYVSRGLSGRKQIRYLCIPELTKIVLKAQ